MGGLDAYLGKESCRSVFNFPSSSVTVENCRKLISPIAAGWSITGADRCEFSFPFPVLLTEDLVLRGSLPCLDGTLLILSSDAVLCDTLNGTSRPVLPFRPHFFNDSA